MGQLFTSTLTVNLYLAGINIKLYLLMSGLIK